MTTKFKDAVAYAKRWEAERAFESVHTFERKGIAPDAPCIVSSATKDNTVTLTINELNNKVPLMEIVGVYPPKYLGFE